MVRAADLDPLGERTRVRRTLLIGALAAAAMGPLAAGCAGPVDRVEITLRDSRYEPGAVTVPVGRPVTIVLRNEDPIDHEWIVGDDGVHDRHRAGTEPYHDARPTEVSVPALETRTTIVTFDATGTLRFVCHLPGHEAYGMTGVLTVVS
jgi:uncharacterized cupredoxin-like copper-binding protein